MILQSSLAAQQEVDQSSYVTDGNALIEVAVGILEVDALVIATQQIVNQVSYVTDGNSLVIVHVTTHNLRLIGNHLVDVGGSLNRGGHGIAREPGCAIVVVEAQVVDIATAPPANSSPCR